MASIVMQARSALLRDSLFGSMTVAGAIERLALHGLALRRDARVLRVGDIARAPVLLCLQLADTLLARLPGALLRNLSMGLCVVLRPLYASSARLACRIGLSLLLVPLRQLARFTLPGLLLLGVLLLGLLLLVLMLFLWRTGRIACVLARHRRCADAKRQRGANDGGQYGAVEGGIDVHG